MLEAMQDAGTRFLTSLKWLMFIPFTLVMVQQAMYEWNARTVPLRTVFDPISITIPDHCAGNDPEILYRRKLAGTFTGRYHSSLERRREADAPVASFDSPWFQYPPRLGLDYRRPLSEFLGFKHVAEPGPYQVVVTWNIRRPGFRDEAVSLASNEFIIKDCQP